MGTESYKDGQQTQSQSEVDLDHYIRLRTMLDSVELGAIKYFLKTQTGKGERFDQLNAQLMPIIEWLYKPGPEIDCPEGYIDCHGVCVPYPCPD